MANLDPYRIFWRTLFCIQLRPLGGRKHDWQDGRVVRWPVSGAGCVFCLSSRCHSSDQTLAAFTRAPPNISAGVSVHAGVPRCCHWHYCFHQYRELASQACPQPCCGLIERNTPNAARLQLFSVTHHRKRSGVAT